MPIARATNERLDMSGLLMVCEGGRNSLNSKAVALTNGEGCANSLFLQVEGIGAPTVAVPRGIGLRGGRGWGNLVVHAHWHGLTSRPAKRGAGSCCGRIRRRRVWI
jgi:hypothetical protein